MLTGTPLDLTPLSGMLEMVSTLYWVLAAGLAIGALCLPARWIFRIPLAVLIPAAFVVPAWRHGQELQAQQAAYRARLDDATGLFQQRCKLSGEKILRTVTDVEGIVWMKWRPEGTNLDDQFKLDDPYGKDCGGEGCILQLLRVTKDIDRNPEEAMRHKGVYRFVESTDRSGNHVRYVAAMVYRGTWSDQAVARFIAANGRHPGQDIYWPGLQGQPIDRFTARYGVTWDDISTREDREHWIAGGSLKVIDLQTNEVIAERVGFMMDRGLGSTAGFRSPWGFAHDVACPEPRRVSDGRAYRDQNTPIFASKVLRPLN